MGRRKRRFLSAWARRSNSTWRGWTNAQSADGAGFADFLPPRRRSSWTDCGCAGRGREARGAQFPLFRTENNLDECSHPSKSGCRCGDGVPRFDETSHEFLGPGRWSAARGEAKEFGGGLASDRPLTCWAEPDVPVPECSLNNAKRRAGR